MMQKDIKSNESDEIVEEAIFGSNQFREMLNWIKSRKGFQLHCKITGNWTQTGEFFKGNGIILKKFNGEVFQDALYLLLQEGDIGKSNILIGRRIIRIQDKQVIHPFQSSSKFINSNIYKQIPQTIEPNVFVIENYFKKDMQNQNFFRSKDYDNAVEYLSTLIQKYEVNAYIEGILFGKNRQIPCIISGTVQNVANEELFISLWDAFDPTDPLNDDTKEWLTRDWTVEVSQAKMNKIHPQYLLFETGEELALTKKVLNVKSLSVTLGGRDIIKDVNFELNKGEILGIIGESGAGKSTALKAILGEFDYEGNIRVFGLDAHKTKAIAPFIGYVPQDLSRMYSDFNCLENIVAFGRLYGVPDDILIQRGKKILTDLGIGHVANQPVKSLSGGQKRRASIAIAMVHNPYLIFLDEPTSGLDPLARYELWEYLDIINKDYGITLCVISHYLDEIEYCDKACIFLRGIGFFDFDSPTGLKQKLPGKGLALEVTLQSVSLEAIKILQQINKVEFVIQRGERIRILSQLNSDILATKVLDVLKKNNILVHSIALKVNIDMVDYFTYVSMLHQQSGKGELGHLSKKEMIEKMKLQSTSIDDVQGFFAEEATKSPDTSKSNE